jgi:hypothetical protein
MQQFCTPGSDACSSAAQCGESGVQAREHANIIHTHTRLLATAFIGGEHGPGKKGRKEERGDCRGRVQHRSQPLGAAVCIRLTANSSLCDSVCACAAAGIGPNMDGARLVRPLYRVASSLLSRGGDAAGLAASAATETATTTDADRAPRGTHAVLMLNAPAASYGSFFAPLWETAAVTVCADGGSTRLHRAFGTKSVAQQQQPASQPSNPLPLTVLICAFFVWSFVCGPSSQQQTGTHALVWLLFLANVNVCCFPSQQQAALFKPVSGLPFGAACIEHCGQHCIAFTMCVSSALPTHRNPWPPNRLALTAFACALRVCLNGSALVSIGACASQEVRR